MKMATDCHDGKMRMEYDTNRKVFISSPLRADSPEKVAENIRKAVRYCRKALDAGYIPLAPHVYLPQFMTAGVAEEDDWAMRFGAEWLLICSEMWVFDQDGITAGMKQEISAAQMIGLKVRFASKGEC